MLKLIQRLLNIDAIDSRVLIKLRVSLEFVFVEDFEGVIGLNQNVNVKVYERESAGLKGRRGVDVAVELEELAVGRLKAEDAVPSIRPEELLAQSTRLDGADECVTYLLGEEGVEDDEGVFPARDTRGPTATDAPVMFARADDNLTRVIPAFLHRRLKRVSG
jgi:hypothetical protein